MSLFDFLYQPIPIIIIPTIMAVVLINESGEKYQIDYSCLQVFANQDNFFLLVSTPDQKKIDFFVPSNITSHYTCYCSILKAIFILAEERSATFSRHSKLCNHPSYLKNRSSVFHTISILSSPLIITFLITFWIFSLSKDSILMIFSNCVSNLPAELSSVGSSDLSCSIF